MRYEEYIRQKYLAISRHTGTLLIGVGLYLLLPLMALVEFSHESGHVASFAYSALIAIAVGTLLRILGKKAGNVSLDLAEGGVIVVVAWSAAIVISALPFTFSGLLSFRNALFESVSGWTTTGLSVIMDVSGTPHIFLLWRSLMQFAGGAGLAIVMLSAILGPHGRGLYQAEGRTEQLLPNVKRSAKMVVMIYSGYAGVGVILYVIAGMTVFDALNHSFCALSTGGFSTYTENIGHYNSVFIEVVTIVLMLLGATNIATHYVLLQGKVKAFFRNGEVKLTAILLAIFIPVVFAVALSPLYAVGKGIRVSFFETVSALSTTGYSTVSYANWSDFGVGCLILLMLVGGGICSTAGGIKQYRIFLFVKSVIWEIKAHLLPRSAVQENYIWRGESKFYVSSEHIKEAGNYFFLYIGTYLIGVLIFLAYGYTLRESLFEFASALGTVGLSLGITITGPNAPSGILWTEMMGMFLGRLEFFVIIYSLLKMFRDMTLVKRI
jgi:trk system potassium uptake protein TrkH